MWGFSRCPISSSELLAPRPLTGRGVARGCSEGSKPLSAILTTDATTQHSSSPDSSLSANQPLPAPPPILFPSLPSAAQNRASSQAFGHRFDREQAPALVTTRTCPGSLGQQDFLHQSSQSLLATEEEMRPAVNCSRAKKPWVRAKCS